MRILLGMSGGLDSTYAARVLMDAGHSVTGAVLIMHEFTETDAAENAAHELGIELVKIDARERFFDTVTGDFVKQYTLGRTPNPCIVCNREVKFRLLLDYARDNGFDRVATGHYASIGTSADSEGELRFLKLSGDEKKDQTYMLYRLDPEMLSMILFPLSDITKAEVREAAQSIGISQSERKESQEICFIPSNDHAAYIESRVGPHREGDFVDRDGNILGRHKGICHYTVGQRKGLGIALGARAFITDIDPETDRITVETEPKRTDRFTVSDLIFTGVRKRKAGDELRLTVKVRYQAPRVPVTVRFLENQAVEAILDTPAVSVTKGQSAVFYLDDRVAFGGFIDTVE